MHGDAVMIGGPRDGVVFDSDHAAVAEFEFGSLIHRYIVTTAQREGRTVFTYDGVVDPAGAQDGVESSADRVALTAPDQSSDG